jgi:xylulokinase
VLDMPLERTAVEEGAAYGAALLGGVAGGVFATAQDAVAACVRPVDAVEPDARWVEEYAAGYERFRAVYPALRPLAESRQASSS